MNQTCVVNNKAVRQRQLRLTRGSRNPSRPRTPNQNHTTRDLYPNRKLRGSSGVRNPKTQSPVSPIQRTLRTPQGKRKVN